MERLQLRLEGVKLAEYAVCGFCCSRPNGFGTCAELKSWVVLSISGTIARPLKVLIASRAFQPRRFALAIGPCFLPTLLVDGTLPIFLPLIYILAVLDFDDRSQPWLDSPF
jgi:hypothetical protein